MIRITFTVRLGLVRPLGLACVKLTHLVCVIVYC